MWIINEQHLGPEYSEIVGAGQWGSEGDGSGQPPMGAFPLTFRLDDEDGERHFNGRYSPEAVDGDEGSWGQLDQAWEWGMAYSGATILKVKAEEWIKARFGDDGVPSHLADHYRESTDKDGWYVPFS